MEPVLPGSEEFCPQLVQEIGRLYHQSKQSVTGGLLRSLQASYYQVRDWNRRSMKEHRIGAGLTALACQANELYVGQVGPALAYVLSEGQLHRVEPHIPEAMSPLGIDDQFWPAFHHYPLAAGDSALLLSSNIADTLDQQLFEELLSADPEDALPQLHRSLPDAGDFSALLVSMIEDEENFE